MKDHPPVALSRAVTRAVSELSEPRALVGTEDGALIVADAWNNQLRLVHDGEARTRPLAGGSDDAGGVVGDDAAADAVEHKGLCARA